MAELYISHINIRSMLAGFPELKSTILTHNYHVCLLSETWLNGNVDPEMTGVPGYNFLSRNRPGNKRGGGVGMYIKTKYQYSIISTNNNTNTNLEQLWIKLTHFKNVYSLGVVYKPPNSPINDFIDKLEETIMYIIPTCNEIIFSGDININLLDVVNKNTVNLMYY